MYHLLLMFSSRKDAENTYSEESVTGRVTNFVQALLDNFAIKDLM